MKNYFAPSQFPLICTAVWIVSSHCSPDPTELGLCHAFSDLWSKPHLNIKLMWTVSPSYPGHHPRIGQRSCPLFEINVDLSSAWALTKHFREYHLSSILLDTGKEILHFGSFSSLAFVVGLPYMLFCSHMWTAWPSSIVLHFSFP